MPYKDEPAEKAPHHLHYPDSFLAGASFVLQLTRWFITINTHFSTAQSRRSSSATLLDTETSAMCITASTGTHLRAAFPVFAPSSSIFLRYRGNGIGVSGHSPDNLFEAKWHD
jgi:hypothetical protein